MYLTLWYSQFVKKYYSIEHHRPWLESVQDQARGKHNIVHVLSEVSDGHKGWGGGIEEGTFQQFETYIEAVDTLGIDKLDHVLIDGKARADCAIHILRYLHADSLVLCTTFTQRPTITRLCTSTMMK